MKRNIIFMTLSATLLLAFACQKEDTYVPGKPTVENDNVYFSPDNKTSAVLAVNETEVTVLISRMDSTDALTVPVTAWTSHPAAFVFPEKAEFAAGVATAEYKIKTTDSLAMFVNYPVRLSIDEELTNAYDSLDVYPRFALNVVKEDYTTYATGTWIDYFMYASDKAAEWEQVLQYSEILDTYRFLDVWYPGYSVEFKWDGKGNPEMAAAYTTGVQDSTYGMITANTIEATYADDTFVLNFEWTVSAGSFGAAPQIFVITKKM